MEHDSAIQTIMNNLFTKSTLFNSRRPFETNAEMYQSRPDILIPERNCITVMELTCPFEVNILKSHDYKNTKYQNLQSTLPNLQTFQTYTPWDLLSWFYWIFNKNIGNLLKWKKRGFSKSYQKVSRGGNKCFILNLNMVWSRINIIKLF